jgi:hypothetical protein
VGETQHTLFQLDFNRAIVIEYRPERLIGGAGLLALRQVDHRLGLTDGLAGRLTDPRNPDLITHPQVELLRTCSARPAGRRPNRGCGCTSSRIKPKPGRARGGWSARWGQLVAGHLAAAHGYARPRVPADTLIDPSPLRTRRPVVSEQRGQIGQVDVAVFIDVAVFVRCAAGGAVVLKQRR